MREAYDIASRNAEASGQKGKRQHDNRFLRAVLELGDRVLIRNLKEKGGPGKLRSFWEEEVHVVIRRMNNASPVYEVQAEDGSGQIRRLHRNLLMQCNDLLAPFKKQTVRNSTISHKKVADNIISIFVLLKISPIKYT